MPGSLRATIAAIDVDCESLNHASNDYPAASYIDSGFVALRFSVSEFYRAATTSLKVMSTVMVHPDVPRNSNGPGLGPRR